jgi:hypothetical protein
VKHTKVCSQKDLATSVYSLRRKMLCFLNDKKRHITYSAYHIAIIGVDVKYDSGLTGLWLEIDG